MKFKVGQKVRSTWQQKDAGVGKIIYLDPEGWIGVHFPGLGESGHSLDGRVVTGGWWCTPEDLTPAFPVNLENK